MRLISDRSSAEQRSSRHANSLTAVKSLKNNDLRGWLKNGALQCAMTVIF
ncbi:hypothetical protein PGC34_21465 [Pseudomonas kribbensis]|nr:hypothetical protein [Pseudomonas sp. MWU12-2029]